MIEQAVTESVDARGKKITTFILYEATKKLRGMTEGQVLEIVAEPFEAIEPDVNAWCRMTGHRLVETTKEAGADRYYIERGSHERGERRQLALVLSDAGLEQLISPLGFALAAALSESEVFIYFQGPAVRVLARGFKEKLQGISRPFSGFARKGLAEIGHLPPQEKLRQLRELGAHFYICGPSMEHFGVKKDELIFEDVLVSEYVTFMEKMNRADVHFFLQ